MKTVLVTGGARGIGKAIVEKFAKAGYNVVLNYSKSEEAAYQLAQTYPNVRTFKADISNKKEVINMIEFAEQEFKQIDILVNNAGISSTGLIQDLSEEELNRLFRTSTLIVRIEKVVKKKTIITIRIKRYKTKYLLILYRKFHFRH